MAFTADRRLYLTADKSKVVEEGDKAAALLFAPCGQEITKADAVAYGLDYRDGKIVLPSPKRAVDPADDQKAREKAEDKAASKGEDKSATRSESKSTRKRGPGRTDPD